MKARVMQNVMRGISSVTASVLALSVIGTELQIPTEKIWMIHFIQLVM